MDRAHNNAAERQLRIKPRWFAVPEKIDIGEFADPELAFTVFSQRRRTVKRRAARLHRHRKNTIQIASKPSIAAPNPNCAPVVLKDWVDDLSQQSFFCRVKIYGAATEAIYSLVVGSYPEVSLAVLIDRPHVVAG